MTAWSDAAGPLRMRLPTICMLMGCEHFILLVIAVVVVIIEKQVSEGKGIGSIRYCTPPYQVWEAPSGTRPSHCTALLDS